MRVALDTNSLYTAQAGIARYVRGLACGFRELAPADIEIQEFAWPVENFSYRQPQRAAKTLFRELIWAKWIAPSRLAVERIDLLHAASGVMVIPPRGVKHVVTLHDLAVMRNPQRFRPWHRHSALRQLRQLSKADRIICVSQFTADEAIQLLSLSAKRLVVVYNGCAFQPDGPSPSEAPPAGTLPPEFFLFIGSLEPGKNLDLIRQAYALAASRGYHLPPLVLVGVRWVGVATEGPPPANWHYLGRQPDAVLVYLYRRARALVFPSQYEGFGLPVAEAMALGCPVICSRVASLPEVGGDAACYAELNPAAYLHAMQQLLQNIALREELVERGKVHCRKFSWQKCVQETLRVYREAGSP
jgi:alpha-1,3-rhamnosyl/mannosyltransferase